MELSITEGPRTIKNYLILTETIIITTTRAEKKVDWLLNRFSSKRHEVNGRHKIWRWRHVPTETK